MMPFADRLRSLVMAALCAAWLAHPADAAYPDKPVKIVVGFPPGGTADSVARILAAAMGARLGVNMVVDTRAGANGNIATEFVARAAPDGYTIFFTSIGHAVNPALYKEAAYDPVAGFTAIGQVLSAPNVLVVPASSPFNTAQDLIAYARTHPARLNVASSGTGTSVHLSAELFKQLTGVDLTHIPYKGTGGAMPDLITGVVAMMFPNLPTALPHVQSGKLRALGVTTATRSAAAPHIPTLAEAGIAGYDMATWYGLVGPARMPPEITARLNTELRQALADPALRDKLRGQGADIVSGSPEAFSGFIAGEAKKWARLLKEAKIKVD